MKTKLARTGILVVVLLVLLLAASPKPAYALACTSTGSGYWNTTGTWSCGRVPTAADDVTIQSGHAITLDTSATIASLTVNGILNFDGTDRTLNVTGNVTVASGGTIQPTTNATHSLNVGGNVTNSGTFNGRTTPNRLINVTLNGTSNQVIGGTPTTFTFNNLTIANATGTVSATTSFSVEGTMTINANATFSPAANVVINTGASQGTITGSGTILVTRTAAPADYSSQYQFSTNTLSNMTVDYAGAGNQTISGVTLGSLRTSGSGTKTLSSALTVNNSVIINAGTTLDESTRTMTIGGTLVIYGTLDFSDSTGLIRTGTSGTTTLAMGANGLIRTVDADGLGPATNASLQTQGSGTWDTSSLDSNGTVEYYRSTTSAQTVTDRNYNNLIIGGATQNKTWTLGANRTVLGTLTMNQGATFTLAGNYTLNVGGDWAHNAGTFTHNAGTVNFNRNGTSTLSRAGVGSTETFCNLTISANTMLDTGDDFVAVAGGAGCGTLTTNGVFRRTTTATVTNGGGAVSFNDALNNVTVQLTQTGGANMGNTSVIVSGNVISDTASFPCGSSTLGGRPVLRYFNITPTNTTDVAATLRLYWRDEGVNETNGNNPNDVVIYHCNLSTSTWERLSGTYTRSGNIAGYNWVQLTNVTTFSPFAIGGGPGAPTAVTLSDFTAYPAPGLPPVLPSIVVGILLGGTGGIWWWRRQHVPR